MIAFLKRVQIYDFISIIQIKKIKLEKK